MRRPDFKAWLAPLLAGLALALSFPNFLWHEWNPLSATLAWVALWPLLNYLEGCRARQGFARAWRVGFIFYLLSLYWINAVRPMGPGALPAWVALSAYCALYLGGFGFLWAWGRAKGLRFSSLWGAALWLLFDFARERILTGFPWVAMGASQAMIASMRRVAEWGGQDLLTLCVVGVNLAFFQFTRQPKLRLVRFALAGWLALLLALSLSAPSQRRPDLGRPSFKAAVVQGNIDQDQAWTESYQDYLLATYGLYSMQALSAGAQVIVWPESAFPGFYNLDPPAAASLRQFVNRHQVTLITGSSLQEGDSYTNACVAIQPGVIAGGMSTYYRKRHLVPFGEYLPLRRSLPLLDRLLTRLGVTDFVAGKAAVNFDLPQASLAPMVCYESVYPSQARETAATTQGLVIITVDTWFGNSAAPRYHLGQAALRAAESGRWVLRSAATGISAIIDPSGELLAQVPLNQAGWVAADLGVGWQTPFERWGRWPLGLALGVLMAGLGFILMKKPSNYGAEA